MRDASDTVAHLVRRKEYWKKKTMEERAINAELGKRCAALRRELGRREDKVQELLRRLRAQHAPDTPSPQPERHHSTSPRRTAPASPLRSPGRRPRSELLRTPPARSPSTPRSSECRIFEHFFVASAAVGPTSRLPRVAFHFPKDVALPANVLTLCFPGGNSHSTASKTVDVNGSCSQLNELLFGQCPVREQRGRNSWVFLINGHGGRRPATLQHRSKPRALCTLDDCLYGACVMVDEMVASSSLQAQERNVPLNPSLDRSGRVESFAAAAEHGFRRFRRRMSSAGGNFVPSGGNETTSDGPELGTPDYGRRQGLGGSKFIVVPHCYCMLSRTPCFALLFDLLRCILGQQRLRRMRSGPPGARLSAPIVENNEEQTVGFTKCNDNGVEDYTLISESTHSRVDVGCDIALCLDRCSMLHTMYRAKLPDVGCRLSLHLGRLLPEVRWQRPTPTLLSRKGQHVEDLELLAEWGLAPLFSLLPLDEIIFLAGCVALELKVILVGQDVGTLSASALSLLPLIRPLLWVHPIIPLLPSDLLMMCDSPVPLIAGVQTLPPTLAWAVSDSAPVDDNQDVVVVLLQEGSVRVSESMASQYQKIKLPGAARLRSELMSHHVDLLPPESGQTEIGGEKGCTPIYDPTEAQRSAIGAMAGKLREHVGGLLRCARMHTKMGATFAPGSLRELRALEKIENETGIALGSQPWHFLDRLRSTQSFQQWDLSN